MLGCQDFCGYYDWTFHCVRRRWGQEAVRRLWAEAIGGEAQQHYTESALRAGLRGLYEQWTKTGVEESCDWTFTLDEARNVLRCDMRDCPSKGFLINNDLHADEDYCNHCMGWIVPLLTKLGAEVVEHEHNHCGQCWFTMGMKDRPSQPLLIDADIRNDPRWKRGYLDRWVHNRPLPLVPSVSPSSDPCEVLESWFRTVETIILLGDVPCGGQAVATPSTAAVLASSTAYSDRRRCPQEPLGVLISCQPTDLAATAVRYYMTAPAHRPLLMHAFLPGVPCVDFLSAGLPRPVPILPLLIRKGVYTHQPGGPHPTTMQFLVMLAAALSKQVAPSSM